MDKSKLFFIGKEENRSTFQFPIVARTAPRSSLLCVHPYAATHTANEQRTTLYLANLTTTPPPAGTTSPDSSLSGSVIVS
jgi:hypothetical protein